MTWALLAFGAIWLYASWVLMFCWMAVLADAAGEPEHRKAFIWMAMLPFSCMWRNQ